MCVNEKGCESLIYRPSLPGDRLLKPDPDPCFSGDPPFCDVCGHLTVINKDGPGYKCLNCGKVMGVITSPPPAEDTLPPKEIFDRLGFNA